MKKYWLILLLTLLVTLGLLLSVVGPVSAKWVWRDGRWIKVEEEELVEPPVEEEAELVPQERVAVPKPIPEMPPKGKPAPARKRLRFWPPGIVREKDIDIFRQAKSDYKEGRHRAASRRFKRLIKRYPTSPYREESMWLRAEALFAKKNYYAAFGQYEKLLNEYAGTPHFAEALKREYEVAEILFGPARRRVLGIPLFSGNDEAVEILRKVYEHQPTGKLADISILKIADYNYDKGFWLEAEHYYEKYTDDFGERKHGRKALSRSAQSAIAQCKGSLYDTSMLTVARERLQQYQVLYPEEKEKAAATLEHLRNVEAEKEYQIASYYRRAGHPDAAAYYADRVIKNYADTPWAGRAGELLDKMSEKGGRKK